MTVIPEEIFLSPALIKKPVSFKGSGFGPNEMISKVAYSTLTIVPPPKKKK
ncbi:MAG: hypothetical protein R6U38_09495 [Desulfatiglandaceae bacterium]